ncbi:MAG TPA: hypothetical protein VN929_04055 [Burkholderiales bacterium]|nr:hypothetical protein [Burkholderiales bacterium]
MLAATLILALPLSVLLWLSGAVSIHVALGAMTLFVFVVMSAGFLLLRAADAGEMPAPAAWVLGIFATAIAVYALVQLHLLAAAAFAIWALVVLGLSVVFRRCAPAPEPLDMRELAGLLLCGVATLMWCRHVAEVPQILARENLLPAWIDYFIHGGVISHFGDPRAGRQSIDLADFPARFYHYASYMLPAAFAGPLDLPGLPLATSVWLPLGFLTMCAGAYALGAALAGPAGGVAAVAALTVVPDASNYGLRNGFFSYHWNLLAVPGACYAIGVCLLSIALLQRWTKARTLRPLVASACLAGGSALFRVHVFALWFPAWLASAALSTRVVQRRKLAFFGIAVAAFALFVAGFYVATDFAPALELFLQGVHNLQEPTAYTGWYQHLLDSYGSAIAVPAGILLVFPACLGAFAILYPVSVLIARRSRGLQAIDFVPLSLIACYVLLMIAAPIPQHGDPTELTQRPFVLLYAVVAVWTAAAFVNWLAVQGDHGARRLWRTLLASTGVALLLVWPQTGVLSLHKFLWGWPYYTHKVEAGLPQAAVFMRRNSGPGDLFAVQGLKLGWVANDAATELASLTGIPAYLARPTIHLLGGRREQVALERYAALVRVAREESASAALARLRELGIRWYVVVGSEGPVWDAERRDAAFVDGRVAVYSSRNP